MISYRRSRDFLSVLLAISFLSACAAYTKPTVNKEGSAGINPQSFNATILSDVRDVSYGIGRSEFKIYGYPQETLRLKADLEATGLFKSVIVSDDPLELKSKPPPLKEDESFTIVGKFKRNPKPLTNDDIYLVLERDHELPRNRYCFSEPMLAVLTFWIIPDVNCFYTGYSLRVLTANSGQPIAVRTVGKQTVLTGLIAPLFWLFPGWTREFPREDEQFVLKEALIRATHRSIPSSIESNVRLK